MKYKLLKIPNHLIVACSSWLSKIVIAGVQLAGITYLLSILGEEKYAAFSLLTGLLVWCSIVDFGIGTGLQNYISEFRAKNKDYRPLIKAALQLSFGAILLFIVLFYFLLCTLSHFCICSISAC